MEGDSFAVLCSWPRRWPTDLPPGHSLRLRGRARLAAPQLGQGHLSLLVWFVVVFPVIKLSSCAVITRHSLFLVSCVWKGGVWMKFWAMPVSFGPHVYKSLQKGCFPGGSAGKEPA